MPMPAAAATTAMRTTKAATRSQTEALGGAGGAGAQVGGEPTPCSGDGGSNDPSPEGGPSGGSGRFGYSADISGLTSANPGAFVLQIPPAGWEATRRFLSVSWEASPSAWVRPTAMRALRATLPEMRVRVTQVTKSGGGGRLEVLGDAVEQPPQLRPVLRHELRDRRRDPCRPHAPQPV